MIEKMSKIELIVLEKNIDSLLFELQKTQCLHLEEAATPAEKKLHFRRIHLTPTLEKKIETMKKIQTQLHHIFSQFNISIPEQNEKWNLTHLELDKISAFIRNLDKKISKLKRRQENLKSDLESLKNYLPARQILQNALNNMKIDIDPYQPTALLTLPNDQKKYLDLIKEIVIRDIGPDEVFHLFKYEVTSPQPNLLVVLYTSPSASRAILEDLWEEGFQEFNFPNRTAEMSLKETLDEFDSFIETASLREKEVQTKLHKILEENQAQLVEYLYSIESSMVRYENYPFLGKTEKTLIVNGWVPASKIDFFKKQLMEKYQDRILINELEIVHDEIPSIPTQHKNPKSFSAFEGLLKLFPPATYGSMDPTRLNSFTFPFFFGFMLGDVVYGLLVLLLAWIAKKKLPPEFAFVSTIMRWAGYSSVIFGVLFWEFLGNFGEGMSPFSFLPILHRQHHIKECIALSLLIGAIHISTGFFLGAHKAFIHGKKKKAIGELSVIAVIWLLFILVGSIKNFGIFPTSFISPTVFLILLNIGIIGWTSGVFSVIELFSTVSNVLSYARLMAIGFSSVILAYIANSLGQQSSHLATGILIGVSIHLINLVLGIFGPALHSLRLHYVEFFPKFYDAEGIEFTPLNFRSGRKHQ